MSTDDVINRADALMYRHRSHIARAAEQRSEPGLADSEVTDIPILTEIIDVSEIADLHLASLADSEDTDVPILTEIIDVSEIVDLHLTSLAGELQEKIDAVISAWLNDALSAALEDARQYLLAELTAKASTTLLPQLREIIAAHRSGR